MALDTVTILLGIALVLAVLSLIPWTHSHYVLAVAVLLVVVAALVKH
jgi:hypothetical protein